MANFDSTFRGAGSDLIRKNFTDIRSIIPTDMAWCGGLTFGVANLWGQIWATGGTCESGIRVKNDGSGADIRVAYREPNTLNGRLENQGSVGITGTFGCSAGNAGAGSGNDGGAIGGYIAGYTIKQGEEIFIEGRNLGYVWAESTVAGTSMSFWAN